jgi:hypothetical protein
VNDATRFHVTLTGVASPLLAVISPPWNTPGDDHIIAFPLEIKILPESAIAVVIFDKLIVLSAIFAPVTAEALILSVVTALFANWVAVIPLAFTFTDNGEAAVPVPPMVAFAPVLFVEIPVNAVPPSTFVHT